MPAGRRTLPSWPSTSASSQGCARPGCRKGIRRAWIEAWPPAGLGASGAERRADTRAELKTQILVGAPVGIERRHQAEELADRGRPILDGLRDLLLKGFRRSLE